MKSQSLLVWIATLCVFHQVEAGSPVWTFTPLTATTIAVPTNNTATIQYQVTNQSRKSHILTLTHIPGISQDTSSGNCANPFVLNYRQSCILTLAIDGATLQGNVVTGPVVCEQGSALECYQPSVADSLNISLTKASGGDTTLSISVCALGLSVNDPGLNAALTGMSRIITITNSGANPATNVTYSSSPTLAPSEATISPTSCDTIPVSGTCVLTITPGDTATATPGDTNPTPITLSIAGTNTNTLTPRINVLTYGSVYQGGYLFAVDDTTPNTGSIGGTVVSQADSSLALPVVWSSNGIDSASVSNDSIPGVDEASTVLTSSPTYSSAQSLFNSTYSNTNVYPFPSSGSFLSCNGKIDGACNSANILTLYNTYITNYGVGSSAPYTLAPGPTLSSYYAAGLCTATINAYSDWYLPAICEMGFSSGGGTPNCSAGRQNIASQLPGLLGVDGSMNPDTSCTYGSNCLFGNYWSSTEYASSSSDTAWYQFFSSHFVIGNFDDKFDPLNVRCTRTLTH